MPGWSFAYLTNWKELTRQRRVGQPPRRVAPVLALGVLIFLIVESHPGLEIRPSCPANVNPVRTAEREGLAAPPTG